MTTWRLTDPRHIEQVTTFRLSLEPSDAAIEGLVEAAARRNGIRLERVLPTDPPSDPVAYLP